MLGLSVPVGWRKFTVHTYNKDTEVFEDFPLDDLTDVIECTQSEVEDREVERLYKLWRKGVKATESAKKQQTNKGGAQHRHATVSQRSDFPILYDFGLKIKCDGNSIHYYYVGRRVGCLYFCKPKTSGKRSRKALATLLL